MHIKHSHLAFTEGSEQSIMVLTVAQETFTRTQCPHMKSQGVQEAFLHSLTFPCGLLSGAPPRAVGLSDSDLRQIIKVMGLLIPTTILVDKQTGR